MFHVSLEDLLMEEDVNLTNKNKEQITLEDLMKINLHNRKMTLLLISNMLYRYIVMGQYENAPIDYMRLMIPSVIAGVIGLALCISYVIKTGKKGVENYG